MNDLRDKVRLNKGELPTPNHAGPRSSPASTARATRSGYDAERRRRLQRARLRVRLAASTTNAPNSVGPTDLLDPQDLIIAFSDGTDDDGNGFTDDIAGWDFLDNDNDPFDDVQYGHGTGEAQDSSAEANNGGQTGSCPNCMVVPLRVGDSFVADVNHFAQAVLYAVDNGVLVIQEALGTLNKSHARARDAVDYAYAHGVDGDRVGRRRGRPAPQLAVELPAHDRRQLGHASTTTVHAACRSRTSSSTAARTSRPKITLAIPSTSCSSNATGRGRRASRA